MRCLNGEIFARLVVSKPEHEERCRAMGITDFKKIYTSKDLASGENIIFAATGVTDGTLMKGVRFFGDGVAHQLAGHAEQAGPHPLHRHHPRRADAHGAGSGSRPCGDRGDHSILAEEPVRRHRGEFHRLHGLHARDAVPAALLPAARRPRRRRDRDVVGAEPRHHAGADRDPGAAVGPARRSLRPQDHGRPVARELRRHDVGDGVRHARRGTCSRCAPSRGCSPATAR